MSCYCGSYNLAKQKEEYEKRYRIDKYYEKEGF